MAEISKEQQEAFIISVTEAALAARDAWGILPSVAVAQACLESAYGTKVPAPWNVLGIKDLHFDLGSMVALTHDDPHRQGPARMAIFENFRNATHCFMQYGRLLMRVPGYRGYRNALPHGAAAAANALQGTFSTDAHYAAQVMRIWADHGLERLDGPALLPPGVAAGEPGTGTGTGTGTAEKRAA